MASDLDAVLGTPSHGAVIRDAAVDLINRLGIMRSIREVPTFQWQPEDEPGCGVYLVRETSEPDGDFNAGEPHFLVSAVIGVSVLVRVDDPSELATATDFAVNPIQNVLLRTPEFLSLFEGFQGITRSPSYPTNASAYMSETRFEFTVGYRARFEPIVPDDYLKTELVTRQLGSDPQAPPLRTVIDTART